MKHPQHVWVVEGRYLSSGKWTDWHAFRAFIGREHAWEWMRGDHPEMRIAYAKTKGGQLLFDLAFVQLTDKWIAQKHKISIRKVRELRAQPAIKKLAKNRRPS